MKESYREGLANHLDPESCVASRKAAIEALTGAPAGRVLSCEIFVFGVPTSFNRKCQDWRHCETTTFVHVSEDVSVADYAARNINSSACARAINRRLR